MKKKLVVLTGAGISAESGLKTFRDANGLWEGYDVMQVASIDGWHQNPQAVLNFYNLRRKQLLEVQPNQAHYDLVSLEKEYDTTIITQNVDDLHERAGSKQVIHLHGELLKVRSVQNSHLVYTWHRDLFLGDSAEDGMQLRPHIVWFGELVPQIEVAIPIVSQADIILIVGTSLQVYPAASLLQYGSHHARFIYVDPSPSVSYELRQIRDIKIVNSKATSGIKKAIALMEI
ncbi:MAG: NAD-dependent deacylase [Saprospiraceae bacterium]|nr:NAD-dependent deacylase [Saprospiraceae bacterium]